jgi:hypothetical protein
MKTILVLVILSFGTYCFADNIDGKSPPGYSQKFWDDLGCYQPSDAALREMSSIQKIPIEQRDEFHGMTENEKEAMVRLKRHARIVGENNTKPLSYYQLHKEVGSLRNDRIVVNTDEEQKILNDRQAVWESKLDKEKIKALTNLVFQLSERIEYLERRPR